MIARYSLVDYCISNTLKLIATRPEIWFSSSSLTWTNFGQAGPVLDVNNGRVGPILVDQNWSGWTDFCPRPIFTLQTTISRIIFLAFIFITSQCQ